MVLSRRTAGFLLAFGVWSWIIWPTFLRNIWGDERSFAPSGGPTGFLIVHALLTAASLAFGTAIGWLGYRGLRHKSSERRASERQASERQASERVGA